MITKLPAHPYHPISLEIGHYVANRWDTLTLVSMFSAGCAGIFSITYFVVKWVRPKISTADLLAVMWFVLCMGTTDVASCYRIRPLLIELRRLHPSLFWRIFLLQLQEDGEYARFVRTIMERILLIGFKISNAKCVRFVHGNDYCRRLGPSIFYCSLYDHDKPYASTSSSGNCFSRTALWRRALLRN